MSFARELAPYLGEPSQMRSGVVGKNGRLHLAFERRGDRTALVAVQESVPLHVQQALYWDEGMPGLACVHMIDTAGCILQGDRLALTFQLGCEAEAHITTQAATKIHEMDANYASQEQKIVLGENSYLEYLPKPMIPHKHARFVSRTQITLPVSATLLYAEVLMSGRKYYGNGEQFAYDLFASDISIARPDGTEVVGERLVVEPVRNSPNRLAIMAEMDVLGNVYLLASPQITQQMLPYLTARICPAEGWAAGASLLPNDAGIVYKILGAESEQVNARVREFWGLARQIVRGVQIARPIWA